MQPSGNSFEAIFETYQDMVYNLCLHYLQNPQDAEEITQDVFVKIYLKRDRFEERSSLKTWIYRIAVNQCLDLLKARKRQKRFGFLFDLLGADQPGGREAPDFNHPGVQLEDREALEKLFDCINRLPDNQKTAVILKYLEDLSMREIAAVTGMSEKAVESLLQRGRQQLKKYIDDREG